MFNHLFCKRKFYFYLMSGDNLHGKQPIKFYSEELTITKLLLIKNHFNFKYESQSIVNSEHKYLELKELLSD